jgi:hypothetical protein
VISGWSYTFSPVIFLCEGLPHRTKAHTSRDTCSQEFSLAQVCHYIPLSAVSKSRTTLLIHLAIAHCMTAPRGLGTRPFSE